MDNNSTISLSYLIEAVESYPIEDRNSLFNKNFPNSAHLYNIIENIISSSQDQNEDIFSVSKKAASYVLGEVDAREYIGKTFDNWIIVDVISMTNKSIILKATPADGSYDQTVAIKIPSPLFKTIANDNHIKKQAHLMEVLKHPNLIEVKGAGTACNVDYVVMEYLSGLNIVEHCQKKQLSTKAILDQFTDICACVDNMHKYAVIHSDLKPDNIILNSQGIVKLFDFDLSNVQDNKVHSGYDYNNIDGNTEKYASPEQLISGEATELSDIFSLGLILFEMLSGNTFDLHNPLKNINVISKEQGKKDYTNEIISIITKACQISPVERYKTVRTLMEDIGKVFDSSVPKAHKAKILVLYSLRKKIKHFPRTAFTMIFLSCAIFFSLLWVSVEYQISKNNIKALITVMDSRKVDSITAFDAVAEKIFNQSWLFKSSQYRQLMDFGDAYYGSGKLDKSIRFFAKAKSLYSDKMMKERINATSKLALAYYTQGELRKAVGEIDEYKPVMFSGEPLVSPQIISLFFTAIEVNSQVRHLNWLENGKYSVEDIIKDISLSGYTNGLERQTAMMNLKYFKSVDTYYTIYNGDFASSSVYQSEETYQQSTKPLLEQAKSSLLTALAILKEYSIKSHREPLIYLWLGRLESELGNDSKAMEYSDKGVKLTMKYFGFEHPRVIDALLKEFAAMRFIDPVKGLTAIKMALGIASNYKKANYQSFLYKIIIETALTHGNMDYARDMLFKLIVMAKEKEKLIGLSFSDIDSITSSISSFTDHNIVTSYKLDNLNLLEDIHYFEKQYIKFTSDNSNLDNIELIRQIRGLPPQEAAKAIHESYYDQLKKFNADESDFYDFRFTGQYYIDTCLQYKPCDPKPFFNEVESSFIWTENENKYSFDKLSLSLRMANAYIETKVFSKGKDKLAEVKPIFDYLISFNPTSLFVAIYNSLLITILIEEEKYTQASELIDEAFVIVAMHYSNKSDLYKKIVLQKNLLKQKSYL